MAKCTQIQCKRSLVSRPPPFLPSICVHNNTREWKTGEKQGWPGNIHHLNDIRWTRGKRRGGGAQLPKQCTGLSIRALHCRFGLPILAWWKLLVLTSKKLAFCLVRAYLDIGPSPPHPPCVHSHDEWSQAFPVLIFRQSSTLPCIIVNANWR